MNDKTTTLLILRRRDEILLAMKKRGHGVGLWNGVGGKIESGETVERALVRECQEEIGVTPTKYHKVAEHDFAMDTKDAGTWHMQTHTYLCNQWEGEPIETDEMAPRWFPISTIPYDQMWPDDRYWLPLVLRGKLLKTLFTFDKHNTILAQEITEVGVL